MPFVKKTRYAINQFLQIEVTHVLSYKNHIIDALAKLAISQMLPDEREIQITNKGTTFVSLSLGS